MLSHIAPSPARVTEELVGGEAAVEYPRCREVLLGHDRRGEPFRAQVLQDMLNLERW